jgi:hypothetical protein
MMVHGPNRANRQQLTGDRHRKSIIFLRPARLEPGFDVTLVAVSRQIEKDDRSKGKCEVCVFFRSRASVFSFAGAGPQRRKPALKKLLLANPITFGDKAAGKWKRPPAKQF